MSFDNLNLAIYSTYCGSTENATFCRKAHSTYPSYFISNNVDVLIESRNNGWVPILLQNQPMTNDPIISATQSKLAKVVPHLFTDLVEYDFLVYVDDKYLVDETLLPDIINNMVATNSPIALKEHPFVSANVLHEYTESLLQERYYAQKEKMWSYIANQVENGSKLIKHIHYATGCIVRNMRHRDTNIINETWLNHINDCGIECQVSFFFISQQFPNITTLPVNIFY